MFHLTKMDNITRYFNFICYTSVQSSLIAVKETLSTKSGTAYKKSQDSKLCEESNLRK